MASGAGWDEGFTRHRGGEAWYRVVGDLTDRPAGKRPVLLLHGGPGLSHESLEPLRALARSGRPVAFYDQLGCGNSTRSGDPGVWGVGPFLQELAILRRDLGLDKVHLLGHSWGGLLAMEHALEMDTPPESLVLVGAIASGRMVFECRQRFYERLPREAREVIRRHEAAGTYGHPEYAAAMDLFYKRYACRLDPWPDWLDRALAEMDVEANAAMWGPPNAPGPLATWELGLRLGGIEAPTLVVAGRYDGMASGQEREIGAGVPHAEVSYFEESAHYPFAEEPGRFFAELEAFLARAEDPARRRL